LLQLVIVEGLANVSNRSVVGKFITADDEDFLVKAIEGFFVAIVTAIAALGQELGVELEGGSKSLLGEFGFLHDLIMTQNATEVKGVNRPERYG
jgi:hypothetical protein